MTPEKRSPPSGVDGRRSEPCNPAHTGLAQPHNSDAEPLTQWRDRVVATIVKNSREEIRISIGEIHGRTILNVRTWWAGADGVMRPGKGLACRVDLVPQLAAGLADAELEARAMGLID